MANAIHKIGQTLNVSELSCRFSKLTERPEITAKITRIQFVYPQFVKIEQHILSSPPDDMNLNTTAAIPSPFRNTPFVEHVTSVNISQRSWFTAYFWRKLSCQVTLIFDYRSSDFGKISEQHVFVESEGRSATQRTRVRGWVRQWEYHTRPRTQTQLLHNTAAPLARITCSGLIIVVPFVYIDNNARTEHDTGWGQKRQRKCEFEAVLVRPARLFHFGRTPACSARCFENCNGGEMGFQKSKRDRVRDIVYSSTIIIHWWEIIHFVIKTWNLYTGAERHIRIHFNMKIRPLDPLDSRLWWKRCCQIKVQPIN